jgi:hypothetical protein
MVLQPKKECRDCKKHRGERYFQGVPDDICSSCLAKPEMPEHFCGNCEKYRTAKEIYFTGENGDELICRLCHPEMLLLTCDVCNADQKPSTDFPVLERAVKVYIRRCFRCFTCTTCLKKFADKDGFWPGTAKCRTCYKAEREFKCDRCLESLPEAAFSGQRCKRLCIPCSILGFSPVDLRPYACTRCKKEYGHKKYKGKQLEHWNARKKSSPLECEACLKNYER